MLVAAKTARDLGWDIHFVSDHGLIAGVPFSLRSNSWGETFTIWLNHGHVYLESKSNGTVIASKKNKHNVEDFIDQFDKSQLGLKADEKEKLQQWISDNKQSGDEDILDPLSAKYRDPAVPERWYLPRGEFAVTASLIGICVVLFALMVISGVNLFAPSTEEMLTWGADNRMYTVGRGEWWRIFTAIFVHYGVVHLLMNMVSLYAIGLMLEPFIGKWRFLAAFLVTGVGGSNASLFWNDNAVSAGASGSIFGLFGLLLALLTTNLIEKSIRNSLLPNIIWVVAINLFLGILPIVDYAAHIGGLVTGLVLGYLYFFMIRKTKQPVFYSVIGAALIGIAIIITGLRSMDNVGILDELKK
ncbi:MAG: rhomboid family intramembrane serine protease [Chitinophagaceae bacterium]|nr:rhomboid family intramembrane serine protease [Chitinophagaceae bacterium]